MAKIPDGMIVLTVEPRNYDQIIELSQNTPKDSYTREDLERMRSEAQARNKVALVMFMSPDYWLRGLLRISTWKGQEW